MRRLGLLAVLVASLIGLNAALAGGETVTLGDISAKVPESWKKQKPTSRLRAFQFAIPKVDGDKEGADLAIFTKVGGTTEQNIERWKGQFIPPEGKTIDEASKLEKFKVGKTDVIYFDVSGTYKHTDPGNFNAKPQLKPNFRRINVILDTDKGSYFITLVGPAKTMAKNKEAFDNWIKAFK